MRILAIDQSFTSCGFFVLENKLAVECERFVTDKTQDIFYRAWEVVQRARNLAHKYEVDYVALEGLAFSKFGNATRDLAGLQFVLVTTLRYINMFETCIVPPNTVKLVATGKGNAQKEQLYNALPEEIRDLLEAKKYKKTTGRYDLTDAYWIGISATNILEEKQAKQRAMIAG